MTDQPAQAAIEIRDLTKVYKGGKRALDGINLTIPRGQIYGLLGPKGMPPAVVERLNAEIKDILAQKEVQERIIGAGAIARFMPAEQLQQSLSQDYAKWGKVVREKGMQAE